MLKTKVHNNEDNSCFQWDVAGHKKIINFLQKSIHNNKITHAYLFAGPKGVGKARIAEYFAASLLCDKEDGTPCKKCIFCQQVFKKIHPDLIWVEKEADKKNIAIEQIRSLRERLSRRSFLNSYKIVIIQEAEALARDGWNALLKTLEEPSEKTIIILITANLKNLPATIISRCQLIKFLTVNKKEIYNYFLKNLNLLPERAEILSRLCQGRPGAGIKFIEDKKLLEKYEVEVKALFDIIKRKNIKDRFSHLDNLVKAKTNFLEARENFQNLLSAWILILRDCLLFKTSNSEFIVNNFAGQELEELAKNYSMEKVKELLRKFIQTKNYLYYNVNPRLAVENLVIEL